MGQLGNRVPGQGHEATVWSIVADIDKVITGSADKTIRFWDAVDRNLLRVVKGHARCVRCLYLEDVDGQEVLSSGSSDFEVRLWTIGEQTLDTIEVETRKIDEAKLKHELTKEAREEAEMEAALKKGKVAVTQAMHDRATVLRQRSRRKRQERANNPMLQGFKVNLVHGRLRGHSAAVTCVMHTSHELVSACADGSVYIWDVATQRLLRRCPDVHPNSPINALQFDATRIITGALDQTVKVTDPATGDTLSSLRGHDGRILALQFDQTALLTVATDWTMRCWFWDDPWVPAGSATEARTQDKWHILAMGETLGHMKKMYGTDPKKIMKWNRITNPRRMYVGQRIIVQRSRLIGGGEVESDDELEVDALGGKKFADYGCPF